MRRRTPFADYALPPTRPSRSSDQRAASREHGRKSVSPEIRRALVAQVGTATEQEQVDLDIQLKMNLFKDYQMFVVLFQWQIRELPIQGVLNFS